MSTAQITAGAAPEAAPAPYLTWLYVPGDRPAVVAKALRSGADVVLVDLEDAVAPDRKAYALSATAELLSEPEPGPAPVHVRVNALDGPLAAAEIRALAGLPGLAALRLPKVGVPEEVRRVAAAAREARGLRPDEGPASRGAEAGADRPAHHAFGPPYAGPRPANGSAPHASGAAPAASPVDALAASRDVPAGSGDVPAASRDVRAASPDVPAVPGDAAAPSGDVPAASDDGPAAPGAADGVPPLYPLLESALGIERAYDIATAHPAVRGLALGEADLRAELGVADDAGLAWPRSRAVVAARAAGLAPPAQSVYPDVADLDGLARSCAVGRALGFLGRTAIHPRQLPVIERAFQPTPDEVARAEEILTAAATDTGALALPDGRFVDAAVVADAHRVLRLARRRG